MYTHDVRLAQCAIALTSATNGKLRIGREPMRLLKSIGRSIRANGDDDDDDSAPPYFDHEDSNDEGSYEHGEDDVVHESDHRV